MTTDEAWKLDGPHTEKDRPRKMRAKGWDKPMLAHRGKMSSYVGKLEMRPQPRGL